MTPGRVEALTKLSKNKGPEVRAALEVSRRALEGKFRHAPGLGWLAWDGRRWESHPMVINKVRRATADFADKVQKQWEKEKGDHLRAVVEGLAPRLDLKLDIAKSAVWLAIAQHKVDALIEKHGGEQKAMFFDLLHKADEAGDQAEIWLNLLSSASVSNLVKLSADNEGILTRYEEFDADPDVLNCENGVIDLRTGIRHDHDPALLITKIARGEYHPDARHEMWDKALDAVHPELKEWFQLRLGQSATGRTPGDDVLVVSKGGGENGKTTVFDAVKRTLGDYARLIPPKALMGSAGDHSTELMPFRGARLAVLEETPQEGHLDMQQVKRVTGSGEVTARLIAQDNVTFRETWSTFINTNYRPRVSGADNGTWRRLVSMPWPYTFVGPEKELKTEWHRLGDRRVRQVVADEPDRDPKVEAAILAWLVEGARRWYEAGMTMPRPHPKVILDSTAEWRASSDHALSFVQEMLVPAPEHFIHGADLRDELDTYLTGLGAKPWSAATAAERISEALRGAGHFEVEYKQGRVPRGWTKSIPKGGTLSKETDKIRAWWGVRFRTTQDDAEGMGISVVDGRSA